MAKYDEIRYADLSRFLESVGYVCRKLDDTHVLWEHPEVETATLILSSYRPEDVVWSAHILATKGTLVHHGILDPDDFERWRLNLYVCDGEAVNGQRNGSRKGRKRTGKTGIASDRQHASATADAKKGRKRAGKPRPASS